MGLLTKFTVRLAGKIVTALASLGIIVPATEFTEALTVVVTLLVAAVADAAVSKFLPSRE